MMLIISEKIRVEERYVDGGQCALTSVRSLEVNRLAQVRRRKDMSKDG